jgi:PKD repeat protein
MRKLLLAVLSIALINTSSSAQNDFKPCGTDEMVRRSLQLHPEFQAERNALETFTQNYSESGERSIKIIPVVFHIIHNYGPENITKEQVLDAVRIINEDYQLLNTDQNEVISAFSGIKANVELEFRLAKLDPNGNCTDGITRTVSTLTFNADDNVKSLIGWPNNKYLNIWVVDKISFGAGGYAYLPGSVGSGDDGIVILNTQCGSIGTSGGSNFSARSLTHEIGHYLNLLHTWGDTNSPGVASNCNSDDNVTDTPNTIGVSNQSCNLSQSTCGSPVDNVQNYMDYSTCAKMFTNGQKTRMLAALNSNASNRNNLWSAANLIATGVSNTSSVICAPIADFNASATSVCTNTNVTFNDLSYNASVDGTWNWNWSFPGGTPSSSTQQNPVISYTTPGAYTATLTVTNSAGNDSKTKTGYVYVSTSTPSLFSPILEGFEISAFPQNDADITKNWRYDAPVSGAFSRSTAAAASGSACLRYNNSAVTDGSISSFISPVVNCSAVTTPVSMTFKVAYARRSTTANDKVELWISNDCGKTWSRRYTKNGATLATTTSIVSGTFIPTSNQWRTETVSVTPLSGSDHAMIKISVTDSSGSNVYFDDINIVNSPVGIEDPAIDEYITQVFPNPGSGDAQLNYGIFRAEPVVIQILDLAGRVIGQKSSEKQAAGEYSIRLQEITGANLTAGAYLIRIQAGNQATTRKWMCN